MVYDSPPAQAQPPPPFVWCHTLLPETLDALPTRDLRALLCVHRSVGDNTECERKCAERDTQRTRLQMWRQVMFAHKRFRHTWLEPLLRRWAFPTLPATADPLLIEHSRALDTLLGDHFIALGEDWYQRPFLVMRYVLNGAATSSSGAPLNAVQRKLANIVGNDRSHRVLVLYQRFSYYHDVWCAGGSHHQPLLWGVEPHTPLPAHELRTLRRNLLALLADAPVTVPLFTATGRFIVRCRARWVRGPAAPRPRLPAPAAPEPAGRSCSRRRT